MQSIPSTLPETWNIYYMNIYSKISYLLYLFEYFFLFCDSKFGGNTFCHLQCFIETPKVNLSAITANKH